MSDEAMTPATETPLVLTLAPIGRKVEQLVVYETVKRVSDVALAIVALLFALPFLLPISFLVWLSSPGPVLYRQTRIGRGGRPFQMLKFRSMYADVDDQIHREMNLRELQGDRAPPGSAPGLFILARDPRITPLGHWMRRYSIDELPQFINVLRGEMSLVGPRPSLPWEVELFTPEQCRRHACRPGITGLWQVSNRYCLSIPEMLALDLHYVETRSLKLDFWILWRTPTAVLFGRSAR
jgi:lipopolysaccharide/colanic/teichoic acid biosynthesis glycosyltransferase